MMRSTWAIVPAKSLLRGKSRLRSVLGDDERARFACLLLEHLLETLLACELDGVLVATDGDDVASVAMSRGAHVLRDRGEGRLSEVVDRALAHVTSRGAEVAVVLMADLPRIEPADIDSLIEALDGHDIALVRDHVGHHTNALALAPPTAIATCFGQEDSFAAHLAAAHTAGLCAVIVENERIAFDVDLPEDHHELTTRRQVAGT
jgi:2-phospho-L-lactate guanylyltransferase